jgi:limonene-1,2-epoxide hydrolase
MPTAKEGVLAQIASVKSSNPREQMEKTVRTFLASYGKKDVDTRIALFADDIHFVDLIGVEPMIGKPMLDKFFRDTIAFGFDIEMNPERIICIADEALSVTRAAWGMTGQEKARLTIYQAFTFNQEGKIKQIRVYFDANCVE